MKINFILPHQIRIPMGGVKVVYKLAEQLASKGEIRDGGSYEARMGGVACWNATMDENKYMVRKWNEMIAS